MTNAYIDIDNSRRHIVERNVRNCIVRRINCIRNNVAQTHYEQSTQTIVDNIMRDMRAYELTRIYIDDIEGRVATWYAVDA